MTGNANNYHYFNFIAEAKEKQSICRAGTNNPSQCGFVCCIQRIHCSLGQCSNWSWVALMPQYLSTVFMAVVLSCPPIAYRYPSIATRHTPLRGLLKGAASALQLSVSGSYLPWWKSRTGHVKVLWKTISAAGNKTSSRPHTDLSFHSIFLEFCMLTIVCFWVLWRFNETSRQFLCHWKAIKLLSLHFSLIDENLHPTEQHFLLIGKFLCLSGAPAISQNVTTALQEPLRE